MPERTRAKFGRTLVPADNLACRKQLHHGVNLAILGVVQRVARFAVVEDVLDVLFAEFWSPKHVRRCFHPWLARSAVPCPLRRTQRATAVAGSGRHRNLTYPQPLFQVRDQKRVLEQTSAQANVLDALLLTQVLQPITN